MNCSLFFPATNAEDRDGISLCHQICRDKNRELDSVPAGDRISACANKIWFKVLAHDRDGEGSRFGQVARQRGN